MTPYWQPPPWLVLATILTLAVPSSAVLGLAAAWVYDRLSKRREHI